MGDGLVSVPIVTLKEHDEQTAHQSVSGPGVFDNGTLHMLDRLSIRKVSELSMQFSDGTCNFEAAITAHAQGLMQSAYCDYRISDEWLVVAPL